jgi:hypothetical protein
MWNGAAGIEFAEESGAWAFYDLLAAQGGLVRDTSDAGHGRVLFVNCEARTPMGCQLQLDAVDGRSNADVNVVFWPDGFRDWLYDHYEFARAP